MTFGKIIKQLRRQADMTQEGLAEVLNISGQAVSRWENDLAMPDISLVPVLANLFNVTTDYLLCVDITRKDEKIQSILHLSTQKGKAGLHMEAVEIIRGALNEYPNNYKLMDALMFHLHFYANSLEDAEKRRNHLEEATALGEKILSGCTDDRLRHSAIGTLCGCYTALGMPNKMKKLAESMPEIWQSREFLLALNTRGEEQLRAKRAQVCTLLSSAATALAQLHLSHETRRTWEEMPPDEIMTAQKNALVIIDMLCPDGDYGILEFTRIHAYQTMADICLEAGKTEEGLAYLEQAVKLAIYLDTEYDGSKKHTSALFCGQIYGFYMSNIPLIHSAIMLNTLKQQSYFAYISSTEKGQSLLKLLEDCANSKQ